MVLKARSKAASAPTNPAPGTDARSSERERVYGLRRFGLRNQRVPDCKGADVIVDLEECVDSLFADGGGLSERRRRVGQGLHCRRMVVKVLTLDD